MTEYKISYVVTTYNKLPYLKHVMERLVAARLPDEEVIVVDGGSKDGTSEYIRDLFEQGRIQQFVSGWDKGEAHGFNKAMLMAKGELIKLITDDDAFCYQAIGEAKEFMLANPSIDVLTGNTGLVHLENLAQATYYEDVESNFKRWLAHKEAVWMIGLPLLIRRTSLALTGLFNTGVVQIDSEFTYRITSLNVNIAWCTLMMSVRLENPHSNFRRMNKPGAGSNWETEFKSIQLFYDKSITRNFRSYAQHRSTHWKQVIAWEGKAKRFVLDVLGRKMEYSAKNQKVAEHQIFPTGYLAVAGAPELDTAFAVCDKFMASFNQNREAEFLYRKEETTKILKG